MVRKEITAMESKYSVCVSKSIVDEATNELSIDNVSWSDIAVITALFVKYGFEILISTNQYKENE